MTRSDSVAVVLVIALGATACSLKPREDPSRFYVLAPAAHAAPVETGLAGWTIGIGPVTLPAYLDRTEIVVRRGENEVAVPEQDRWAEPLTTGLQRVITEELTLLLAPQRALQHPWSSTAGVDFAVRIDVIRFDRDSAGTAVLDARWRIEDGSGNRLVDSRRTHLAEPADGLETGFAVAAQSRALGALSQEIAGEIRRLAAALARSAGS